MLKFQIAHFLKQEAVPTHLRSLGFTYMASDLYTAPDPVKAYLNSVASVIIKLWELFNKKNSKLTLLFEIYFNQISDDIIALILVFNAGFPELCV